jgi:hypothetical protein
VELRGTVAENRWLCETPEVERDGERVVAALFKLRALNPLNRLPLAGSLPARLTLPARNEFWLFCATLELAVRHAPPATLCRRDG